MNFFSQQNIPLLVVVVVVIFVVMNGSGKGKGKGKGNFLSKCMNNKNMNIGVVGAILVFLLFVCMNKNTLIEGQGDALPPLDGASKTACMENCFGSMECIRHLLAANYSICPKFNKLMEHKNDEAGGAGQPTLKEYALQQVKKASEQPVVIDADPAAAAGGGNMAGGGGEEETDHTYPGTYDSGDAPSMPAQVEARGAGAGGLASKIDDAFAAIAATAPAGVQPGAGTGATAPASGVDSPTECNWAWIQKEWGGATVHKCSDCKQTQHPALAAQAQAATVGQWCPTLCGKC